MKSTQYLYGIDPAKFIQLSYIDAVHNKIAAARVLLNELYKEPYMTRDSHRIRDINNAIKHNERLLIEVGLHYKH